MKISSPPSNAPVTGEELLLQWRAEIKKQRTQFRKQIHNQLREYQKATDASCVSCSCQECTPIASDLSPSNIVSNVDETAYAWGDPFPIQTTPCGWRLQGRAFTLLDPNPCSNRPGLSRQLGWFLQTGTTQTLRLPNGSYRTYFSAARLSQVTKDPRLLTGWPVYDSNTNFESSVLKFSLHPTEDRAYQTEEDFESYWQADLTDCTACHFSKNFVGFLDSVDGINYPFYAPKLTPTSGTKCQDVSYFGSTPIFEETNFWAGWRSTCIPASNASLVYRDVSVISVPAPTTEDPDRQLFLMVAVQCDGRGMGDGTNNPHDLVEGSWITITDSTGASQRIPCQLCTPNAGNQNQAPKTRLVFFLCNNPNFQSDVRGPFEFDFPEFDRLPANNTMGEWLGVPQIFMDDDQKFIFLFQHAQLQPTSTYPNGLLVASVSAVSELLSSLYAGDPDPQESQNLIYTHNITRAFIQYANPAIPAIPASPPTTSIVENVQIECVDNVPGWQDPTNPNLSYYTIDEHFVFYNKRLHMFFTRKHSAYTANQLHPLSAVSQAVALSSYSSDVLENLLSGSIVYPEEIYYPIRFLKNNTNTFALHRSTILKLRALVAEQNFEDRFSEMFLSYRASPCDPIVIPELLGAAPNNSTLQPTSAPGTTAPALPIELNDPNVYVAADGTLVMLVHCGALGGIILLTAPPGTGGALPDPC